MASHAMTSHRGGDLRPDAPFAISWRCSVSPRSEPLDRSGTWQLAVPGHLRLAAGPVRGPRTGTRALPPGRPPRPGRLHRHDGGRATSGYAGRVVPSPRVGLPRLVRRGWCSRHQAQPPQGLDRTQPQASLRWPTRRCSRRARPGHYHQYCPSFVHVAGQAPAWCEPIGTTIPLAPPLTGRRLP
jgi:hypothetical protein